MAGRQAYATIPLKNNAHPAPQVLRNEVREVQAGSRGAGKRH